MLTIDVVPGVHLIEYAHVNCYLIEGQSGLTLVDSGLPGVWHELGTALRTLGHRPEDLRALVLTHAHFDHVGTSRRLVQRLGVPVHLHPQDAELAAHPYRYAHENPRSVYPLRHPRALPVLGSMLLAGAAKVRGIDRTVPLMTGSELDVWGMTNGVAAALAMTGLLEGKAPTWHPALQEGSGLRALASGAAMGANVAAQLAGGWAQAELHELPSSPPPEGTGSVGRSEGRPVAISTVEGRTCALSAVCPHLGGVLRWNDAERSWDCPLHGSRFAPDGTRLEGPALSDLRAVPAPGVAAPPGGPE